MILSNSGKYCRRIRCIRRLRSCCSQGGKVSFCAFSARWGLNDSCSVDNKFITEWLPEAKGDYVKVYLFGLYLCSERDGSITSAQAMAEYLSMPLTAVERAFDYWKETGLVTITSLSPLKVVYNHPREVGGKVRKFKAGRFTDFNAQLQALYPHRMITPTEYERYYDFISANKVPDELLIMIAAYCINGKGESVNWSYILTCARDWINQGIRTAEQAEEKIRQMEENSDKLRKLMTALGRKGSPDFDDKQMYMKWTQSWDFTDEVILHVAASCKNKGGMSKLDNLLDSYFRMSLFTVGEIDAYNENRRKLRSLTRDIYKHLGLWCENPDQAAEVYVSPWLSKGFERDALLKIADQCFIRGVKTAEGMNATVNKMLKEGCLSASAIDEYLAGCAARDEQIAKVIAATGSSRTVTMNDRDLYAVWADTWGFSDDVILYAASLAQGRANAMSNVGNTLANWKRQNITTLEQAKKASGTPAGGKPFGGERTYTKQQLDAFLGDPDNFDDF